MKKWYFVLGIVISVSAFCVAGCDESQSGSSIRFHTTSEGSYDDILIEGRNLSYTYFDGKCPETVVAVQSPCWKKEDLKTVHAILSDTEAQELASLVKDSGFLKLQDVYDDPKHRTYDQTITVAVGSQKKTVVYKGGPETPPMPEAFKQVKDRLFKLVESKFDLKQ